MRLAVIIPAFNEEQSIGWVLERMPAFLNGIDRIHIFVVDDGRTDATGAIASAYGATVLRHSSRMGLASAFRTGLTAALASGAELIVTIDADGQYDPREISLLLNRLRSTGSDLVVGDRQVRTLAHMPLKHQIGNVIGSLMLRVFRLTTVSDASSGFRVFTGALGRTLQITSRHTYTHEMLIQAHAWGFAVTDVPVTFHARRQGYSKLIRSLRHHILRSCGTIVRAFCSFRPDARLLFITRTMQHRSGGMQQYMRTLVPALRDQKDLRFILLAHRGGFFGLPFFLLKASVAAIRFDGSQIHLGDAAFAPLLPILRLLRPRLRRSITVYGLDLVWKPAWYQWMLRRCLPFADRVVAISRATAAEAFTRGGSGFGLVKKQILNTACHPERSRRMTCDRRNTPQASWFDYAHHDKSGRLFPYDSLVIIPCGIGKNSQFPIPNDPAFASEEASAGRQIIPNDQSPKTLLLLGRQIRRKGTVWFLSEVAPKIFEKYPDLRIVIAGDGPMLPAIRFTVDRLGLGSAVAVFGEISEERKEELYRSGSLFVMPNIPVAGDMEGFGMVCIEAAAHGLPVVASRLEGITDAVIDGETGTFFEPLNAEDAVAKIIEALEKHWDPEMIRQVCMEHFDSAMIARRYVEEVFG